MSLEFLPDFPVFRSLVPLSFLLALLLLCWGFFAGVVF